MALVADAEAPPALFDTATACTARSVARPNAALQPLADAVTATDNSRIPAALQAEAGQPGKAPAKPVKKPDGEDDVGTFEDLLTPGGTK